MHSAIIYISLHLCNSPLSESVQFEHIGAPMSLQPFQNPSKEDYFRSLERDYGKPFYQVKPSFDDGLSSYWPYAQNQFRPSHDSNPTVRLHESFIKPISADPYSGNHT